LNGKLGERVGGYHVTGPLGTETLQVVGSLPRKLGNTHKVQVAGPKMRIYFLTVLHDVVSPDSSSLRIVSMASFSSIVVPITMSHETPHSDAMPEQAESPMRTVHLTDATTGNSRNGIRANLTHLHFGGVSILHKGEPCLLSVL
jgi:hypothetical protein